jgi:hypothetical protein
MKETPAEPVERAAGRTWLMFASNFALFPSIIRGVAGGSAILEPLQQHLYFSLIVDQG